MDPAWGDGYVATMPLDPGTSFALKQAGSALARTVLTSIGRALAEFQDRKGERAVAALVAALGELKGLPPDQAAAELDKLLTTGEEGVPDAHDALYETFRSLAATRTEAAWPYIARMTAEYLEQRRGVDSFFRRAAWLLERCEDEDVEVLAAAFAGCESVLAHANSPEVRARNGPQSEVQFTFGGSTLEVKVAPGVDLGSLAASINARLKGTPNEVAKRMSDVVVLLGESRLGWYHSGNVAFGLENGVPTAGGSLDRLMRLFRGAGS